MKEQLFYFMNLFYNRPFKAPPVLKKVSFTILLLPCFGGGKSSIAGYICKGSLFKGAYGNKKYATLHSTTYSGLGEEAATALKSIEIAFRDKYEEKSRNLGKNLYTKLLDLKKISLPA